MSETPATRRAALWVAIVFLLGVAAGGMFGYGYARHAVAAASGPMSEAERRANRVGELTEKLSLTSDQAKQLDAILLGSHNQAKAIHDQSDAQMGQLRMKVRDQIRAILTPDQNPKFEEWLRKHDAERKKNAPK